MPESHLSEAENGPEFARPGAAPPPRVSGANLAGGNAGLSALPVLQSCKHCIPDRRHTAVFEAPLAEVELAVVDPAQQFNAGERSAFGKRIDFDGSTVWKRKEHDPGGVRVGEDMIS
jgi:hypothetical protein